MKFTATAWHACCGAWLERRASLARTRRPPGFLSPRSLQNHTGPFAHPLPQLTRLTSICGVIDGCGIIDGQPFSHFPPDILVAPGSPLRRLLLYLGRVSPLHYTDVQYLQSAATGLEALAISCDPDKALPPPPPGLTQLHLGCCFGENSHYGWYLHPPKISPLLANLDSLVIGGESGTEPPSPASLSVLTRLTRLVVGTLREYSAPEHNLAHLACLPVLKELELVAPATHRHPASDRIITFRHFSEFQGMVSAPQLTRLVLHDMAGFDEDGDAWFEAGAEGWPPGHDAFAAALRESSPAGGRLQVVLGTTRAGQACCLWRANTDADKE